MKIAFGIPDLGMFVCMFVLTQFLWRVATIKLGENPIGQAMSFIN